MNSVSLKSCWSLRRRGRAKRRDVYISTCKLMLKVVRLVSVLTTAVHSRNNCVISGRGSKEEKVFGNYGNTLYILYSMYAMRIKLLENFWTFPNST